MISLQYQAKRGNIADPRALDFLATHSKFIIDVVSSLVPQTDHLKAAPTTFDYLVDRATWELFLGTHVFDSAPGYPFQVCYPELGDVVADEPDSLVAMAIDLLTKWLSVPHEEMRKLSPCEMALRKYSVAQRAFIKNEPHPLLKVQTGRLRLVISVAAHQVLADRILLGPIHRAMIDFVADLASCIGLGMTDNHIDILVDKAINTTDSFGLTSTDQSGFDWKFIWIIASIVAEVYINASGATGAWANAIRNSAWSLMSSLFALSDGRLYALLIVAVRRSGGLDTGHGNSLSRIVLNIAIRLYTGGMPSIVDRTRFPACTMGDDCFESYGRRLSAVEIERAFSFFGFTVSDIYITDGSSFEFCSTRIRITNRSTKTWVATPLSWPRVLFRLLSHEYDPGLLAQFRYELRHLGSDGGLHLRDLLAFIERVGWIREPLESPTNEPVVRLKHCLMVKKTKALQAKGRAGVSKKTVARDAELRAQAKVVASKMPTKALGYQVKTIADPLTHQDIAIISYLHTLGDPWVEDPAGVPLMAGGTLMRRTVKAQIKFEVQIIANASGFAFAALCCDGWVADATLLPNRYASYNGGTAGTPLWYSNASYVGTSFPATTATTATAGLLSSAMPLLDGQVTTTSNVRMVAAGIRAFSDSAVNTAQGKLAVVATSRPYGLPAGGAISASSYTTLSTLPTDVISFQSEPCAGWRAGHSLYAVAIPSDPECFNFFNPPATGVTQFQYPQLAVILSGAAANQTATVQCVFDYEFDIGVTNLTGIDTDPVAVSSKDALIPHIAMMHDGKTGKGTANKALGMQAFLAQSAMTRPAVIPSVIRPSNSVLNAVGGAAKAALGWAASKGLEYVRGFAKGIPVLGGIMNVLGL